MTLKEILASLNLEEAKLQEINAGITALVNSKLIEKDAALQAKETELGVLRAEIKPYKTTDKANAILELVKDLSDPAKVKDAIQLAKLAEDETDEMIKSKVQAVIKERTYLQKAVSPTTPNDSAIVSTPTPVIVAQPLDPKAQQLKDNVKNL